MAFVEARRWLELRAAADVLAQVPRAAVELVRPQHVFNHALLDVLERWPQVGADLPLDCDRLEPTLPVPPPSPTRVSIVCEGSPSASWLAALLQQKGPWECIFTEGPVPKDARFRLGTLQSATSEHVLWVSAESELAPHALQSF